MILKNKNTGWAQIYSFLLTSLLLLTADLLMAQKVSLADIRNELQSPEIYGLYQRTYYSLLDRIDPDGFLQESLTGRYPVCFHVP